MRRIVRIFSVILFSCVVLPGLTYLGLAIYYQDSFMYGTWINGVYCTGKTVEEVQDELTKHFTYEGLTVTGPQGEEFLDAEDLGFSYDFSSALKEYRNNQNPFRWFMQMITGHQNTDILPEIRFQESLLDQWLYQTCFYEHNRNLPADQLSIIFTADGYVLWEDKAQVLQLTTTKEKVKEALYAARTTLDLEQEDCYFTREDSDEMREIRLLFEKINALQQLSLTYQLKEVEKKVTPYEISLWITTDEKGNVSLDKEENLIINKKAISAFIAQMAKDYDTWKNHRFTTHDGREITLKKGNYGTKINQKAEVKFLLELLENPRETIRVPEYTRDVTYKDRNRIDHTYIEIDLTAQRMFYYEAGELKLETDVVTGCTAKGMGTPEMVCYVYNKTEDAILKGEGYRSPVDYWMPVYGGIGIHDASWRNEFGGTIYKKSGSHGCINTPFEKVEELYRRIVVGTPVVIHS